MRDGFWERMGKGCHWNHLDGLHPGKGLGKLQPGREWPFHVFDARPRISNNICSEIENPLRFVSRRVIHQAAVSNTGVANPDA